MNENFNITKENCKELITFSCSQYPMNKKENYNEPKKYRDKITNSE